MIYLLEVLAYLPFGFGASVIFLVMHEIWLRVKNEQVFWLHRVVTLVLGLYLSIVFALTVSPVYGFSLSHFGNSINLMPLQVLNELNVNPMNFWGNILLFVPFGLFTVFLSNRCQKVYVSLFLGVGLSLLIEVLQAFGTRSSDIDDIILNTTGTLCGYILGRSILLIFPFLRKNVGIMMKIDNKLCKKQNDERSIATLATFVLIAVFVAGFSFKTADEKRIMTLEKNNFNTSIDSNISIEPMISINPKTSKDSETNIEPKTRRDTKKGIHQKEMMKPNTQTRVINRPKEAATLITENINAKSAYFWNVSTNTVLYKKECSKKIAPASTTKMLTALTVLDYCDENDEVLVGEEVKRIAEDASRAWINTGNRLTVRQLLVAMLLPSGNDAAYALAVFTGRKICRDDSISINKALQCFTEAMNKKASNIGAINSNFVNPDGYDAEGQYSTAYDLACIAKAFIDSNTLKTIAGSYRISDVWLSGQEVTYYNTNELINPESPYYYKYASGLKTGKSGLAGSCLISCAYIDNELYVCVVMGSTDEGRWQDSLKLYHAVHR
jgi:D-alanyl-D-alanine carboxypeptidase/glycopeptide antibiotics resistance protein